MIGRHKCQGLIGFHNFLGADWGGKFVGLTLVSAYMKLDENDPVIGYFKMLGEGPLPNQLDNGELPPEVKGLEQFVCHVYCSAGPTTLPTLSWKLVLFKELRRRYAASNSGRLTASYQPCQLYGYARQILHHQPPSSSCN